MVRLTYAGSKHAGPEEGKEIKVERKTRQKGYIPPRLSLSAGLTWIGLFICDRDRKRSK